VRKQDSDGSGLILFRATVVVAYFAFRTKLTPLYCDSCRSQVRAPPNYSSRGQKMLEISDQASVMRMLERMTPEETR
jgi:hypothetical protein